MDLGDDRLRAEPDAQRRGDVPARTSRQAQAAVPGRLLGKVVAGAKGAAGSGEHDDPDAVVVGGRGDRGLEQRVDESSDSALSLRAGRASGGRPNRCVSVRRTDGSSGSLVGPPRTTSASTATAPSAVAMTGLRSISRTSGRSNANAATPTISSASAARSTAGVRGSRRGARAARSSSSIARAIARATGASRIATSSRTSASTPPKTDDHARPERRIAPKTDDQLEPGSAIGSTQQAARIDAVVAGSPQQVVGSRPDRRRPRPARGGPGRGRSCAAGRPRRS